jgi:hypothetical protein
MSDHDRFSTTNRYSSLKAFVATMPAIVGASLPTPVPYDFRAAGVIGAAIGAGVAASLIGVRMRTIFAAAALGCGAGIGAQHFYEPISKSFFNPSVKSRESSIPPPSPASAPVYQVVA